MNNAPISNMAPLSIAIIGVGRIGSGYAYSLARSGHDVTVIARAGSKRLQQLRRDNGIVTKAGERVQLRVTDTLNEKIAYDLLVVTTLAYQVEDMIPTLKRSKAKSIELMFNTFDPERLQQDIGAERCSFGMPFIMSQLDDEGKLNLTISSSRKTLNGDKRWADLFIGAGIPSALEINMLLWLRCHTPLCIAMESISVAAQPRGGGASWQDSMTVASGIRGAFAVIKGLGYSLYPSGKARLNSMPIPLVASMLWAVSRIPSFRDLLATGINECRMLVDVVAETGNEIRPALPSAVAAVLAMKPAEVSAKPDRS